MDSSPTLAWFSLTRSGQVDSHAGRHRRWQRLLDAAGLLLLLPSPWCRRWWEVSSEDDTPVERQVGDEDGALGLPIDVIGLGLKLELRPICIDESLMPIPLIKVAHAHFKLAH